MLPGKWIYAVAPRLVTATHASINWQARKQLSLTFPTAKQINRHEGFNGIDGLWLRNEHLPSRSVYNPKNKQGSGITEAVHQFTELVSALRTGDTVAIARQAAFTSHIITDISTPPHQFGHTTPVTATWWGIWKANSDWTEDGVRHVLFELRSVVVLALTTPNQQTPTTPLLEDWLATYQALPSSTERITYLQSQIQQHIEAVYALTIYTQFLESGWNKHIVQKMQEKLLPGITRMVAQVWQAAMFEAQYPAGQ